jgi:hypothetical protein
VFLGGIAKVNSILVMVLRNTIDISGVVAEDGLKTSTLGNCAKKCQQAFLAPLPGMELKPPHLVMVLKNANKHFWRHCRGGHRLKSLVGHDHEHMHIMVAIVYAG